MSSRRVFCYTVSFSFSLLALLYCFLVYQSGQFDGLEVGAHYVAALPNYYLFYAAILPFVAAGVIYLACENRHIRFFGPISLELDLALRGKVRRLQKVLPVFCVLFSLLVMGQDAAEKNHTLPPFAYKFSSETQLRKVTEYYAYSMGWMTSRPTSDTKERFKPEKSDEYQRILIQNGIDAKSTTGFRSFQQWWDDSSWLYRYQSLLSFLAALVISLFFMQIYLLMIVKNFVYAATRNLIVWMFILASFWLPTKLYAAWKLTLGPFTKPTIFWFGIGLVALGALLVFFIRSERNELVKYGKIIFALFSAVLALVSYLSPDLIDKWIQLIQESGLVYAFIFAALVVFALYTVTDYFINSYEEEVIGKR